MTDATTLTEQYAGLLADVERTADRLADARDHRNRQRTDAGREVTADLVDFTNAIEFKRPDAVPADERDERHRELTHDLFTEIEARGLLVEPVRTPQGLGLAILDPSVDAGYQDALGERNAALSAIRAFERDHGDDLKAEQKAARAEQAREALAGDDLDEFRSIVNGDDNAAALTTAG